MRVSVFDEARFGRINRPVACWAPPGVRPQVGSQTVREYVYTYSAVTPVDGAIDSLIMPSMHTACFEMFLEFYAASHPDELCVLMCDGAASHVTPKLKVPENVRIIPLPPYSPQLNPTEQVWDLIRERYFANRIFNSLDQVEATLIKAFSELEPDPTTLISLTGYEWILNAAI